MYILSRSWLIASLTGLVLFLITQIVIPISENKEIEFDHSSILTKEEVVPFAQSFTKKLLSFPTELQLTTPPKVKQVIYQSNATVAGYVNKEQVMESFQNWEDCAPYNTYQALLPVQQQQKPYLLRMDIHMKSGRIIGFSLHDTNSATKPAVTLKQPEVSSPLSAASLKMKQQIALSVLQTMGWKQTQFTLNPTMTTQNLITYTVDGAQVGQARLTMQVQFKQGMLIKVAPQWSIPEQYQVIQNNQLAAAKKVFTIGYVWSSILLLSLAFFICFRYRKTIRCTSKTIIALALTFGILSLLHSWNIIPSAYSHKIYTKMHEYLFFGVQVIFIGLQMIVLYFSFLAGKRLWNQTPYVNLFLTWRHATFGRHIVQACQMGTIYTGILLGVQTILFFMLEQGLHAWVTTDASSSPLNLRIALLYPLLALVAAISEEGFYRLFAVGFLNSWLCNPWLAGIFSAFIWACGHVMYPIFPYYFRLIELLVIGMLFLFIMMKHGWWTAMFAHFIFDDWLMCLPFFLEGTWSGTIIGCLYVALPAGLAYLLALIHRKWYHRTQL